MTLPSYSLDEYLVVEQVQKNIGLTLAAGASGGYSVDVSKSGYTPIGILGLVGSGTSSFALQEFYIEGNNAKGYVRNIHTASATLNYYKFTILYKKNQS